MARDTNRSGRSSRRGRSSAPAEANASPAGGVDLAGVLREAGVAEERIPETIATIRAMSDAQAGEGTAPAVPTPAPPDSPVEMNVATVADAIAHESQRWRARTRSVVRVARLSRVQGHRDTLWAIEPDLLPSPRVSFVGRAIHKGTSGSQRAIAYEAIYLNISAENDQLLTPAMRRSVMTLSQRLVEGQTTPDQNNSAVTVLIRPLRRRTAVLVRALQYAEERKQGKDRVYNLTPIGQQVFNNWPDWHAPDAIPGGGADEADAGEAPSGD